MGDLKKFEEAPFQEAPREDVLEQQEEQTPEAEEAPDRDAPVPLEADEADTAEQRLEVRLDEDEYR
ncbi:hypothetical protein [Actinocorallia libanotica]|uniref:Nucleotide exchange factor GrpE n=1 Tax=Actinocorallia libanotica TaxID=46162 RepID=A0ABP4BEE5_9ACTN